MRSWPEVIDHPLLVAAAVARFGVQAAEHAGVLCFGFGFGFGFDAAALGRLQVAVVELTGDAWRVDIAVQEFGQHF